MKKLNREESWFTMAMSLFSDKKISGCRVARSPSMSRGRRRGCYKASAR